MRLARRGVIGTILVLCLFGASPAARAQEIGKVYRMAIVSAAAPTEEMSEARDPFLRGLFAELRRLGYIEGQNLAVERRRVEAAVRAIRRLRARLSVPSPT